MKRTNKAGVDIIRNSETLRLVGYLCPAGIPTVGWGHTGKDVKVGMKITRDLAEGLLANDLRRFEQAVEKLCPVTTDNQFSALVSFAFNVGEDDLRTSTLRRLHNEGNYAAAQEQFARWNKSKGKVLNGLTTRRKAEAELYGKA